MSSAYQVLARKWRPQTFAEVVGQEHIARTLKNALLSNRIGHAYLFVGSRGIGKTTSARIFAKALNCEHPVDGEPCCQCDSCREIAAGNSLDVIEIDGASHNKVEDVQKVREQVAYPPVKSKYKIYIIDEVHMLTPSAWNALLKTLEEPPAYVKFLFATTEPHKILPTIISRCQRFDLRRIPVPLIAGRLRQIADAEKIFVEDAALGAIARAADGGMRDAQSIFDQVIAFCGGMTEEEKIREQDVISIFGLAGGADLRTLATALLQNDLSQALGVVASLADAGRDLERVFEDFVGYFRNLMLVGTCNDAGKFLEISQDELRDLQNIAASTDPSLVRKVLTTLISQERLFSDCLNKRVALEVLIAQIATEIHSATLDDVLTHLNAISGLIPPDQIQPRVPPTIMAQTQTPKPAPVAPAPQPEPQAVDPAPAPVAPTPQPVAPAPAPQPVIAPVVEPTPAVVEEGSEDARAKETLERLARIAVEDAAARQATPSEQQPAAPETPRDGFRRATRPEFEALKKTPPAQTMTAAMGTEPYDAVVPQ